MSGLAGPLRAAGLALALALVASQWQGVPLPEPAERGLAAASDAMRLVVDAAREFWAIFGPGGRTHPGWFLEHKGHLVIEGVLLAVITFLFVQRPSKPAGDPEELTEQVG
jgi:hypothetical protein